MWQKLIELGKQILSLVQMQQRHEEKVKQVRQDIKTLQQDFNHLRQELNDLTRVVERLASETRMNRETGERDREIQRLRLENILLRFDRGLPPGSDPD